MRAASAKSKVTKMEPKRDAVLDLFENATHSVTNELNVGAPDDKAPWSRWLDYDTKSERSALPGAIHDFVDEFTRGDFPLFNVVVRAVFFGIEIGFRTGVAVSKSAGSRA
jgi:hypothetical protein